MHTDIPAAIAPTRAGAVSTRPTTYPPNTRHHRIDQADPDALRGITHRLLNAATAAQQQAAHIAEAAVGGCGPCRSALDVAELELHACAEWQRLSGVVAAGIGCL